MMKKLKILVTAGATREPIDPVRFISNYATGFLGYAIAREARKRGHRVVLLSGFTACERPPGVQVIGFQTARQLLSQLKTRFEWCDCLIMTAAVGDFRVRKLARKKIKRGRQKGISLRLEQNPDILQVLARQRRKNDGKMVIGFALESEDLLRQARAKLIRKSLEMIVATQIKPKTYPFGPVKLDVLIAGKNGLLKRYRQAAKPRLGRILLDSIEKAMLS